MHSMQPFLKKILDLLLCVQLYDLKNDWQHLMCVATNNTKQKPEYFMNNKQLQWMYLKHA